MIEYDKADRTDDQSDNQTKDRVAGELIERWSTGP